MSVGSIYFTLVSDSLDGQETPGSFWRRVSRLIGRILLFWIIRAVALVVLGIPFFLLSALLALISAIVIAQICFH